MALTLPLTESVGSLSQVLTKQYYGQTLYYHNSDAPLSLAHGLASGTVSIGYFGTSSGYANVFLSADNYAVLSVGYASLTNDLNVGRNVFVTGAATISNNLSVVGSTTITGFLNVGSNANIGSSLRVFSNLFVTGASSLTGALYVASSAHYCRFSVCQY